MGQLDVPRLFKLPSLLTAVSLLLVLSLSAIWLPPAYSQNQEQFAPAPSRRQQNRPPLQGGIDHSELKGEAEETFLQGGADGWGGQFNGQQGVMDQAPALQGGASDTGPINLNASSDPDDGNQELAIEWDRWRNTLIQAIQSGTLANINVHNNIHFVWDPATQMMQSRYPNGTSVWYSISVLPNRKITNLNLTQRSAFPSYDQAVIQAINSLQGNKILQYPKGSKRRIVTQEANVRTAAQSNFQNFNFGDVERQRY